MALPEAYAPASIRTAIAKNRSHINPRIDVAIVGLNIDIEESLGRGNIL
jgi:hypothetical protein